MVRLSKPSSLTVAVCVVWAALCLVLPAGVAAHQDLSDRIAELTKEIARHPKNAALYLKRGELHRLHGEWDAASADYDHATQLAPDLAAVDLARGDMLLAAGRLPAAKIALDRFLAKQPEHAVGLVLRARVLTQLGQHVAAAADFTRAIAHEPDPLPEHYLERAQALAAEGEGHLDEALGGLDEGIQKLGPLVVLELLAIDLELRKKNYDAALARLEQIAAQSQRKEEWLVRRGEILEQAGRAEEAHAAFMQAQAAIESLPPAIGQTTAMTELEARLRAALERQAAEPGKKGPGEQH